MGAAVSATKTVATGVWSMCQGAYQFIVDACIWVFRYITSWFCGFIFKGFQFSSFSKEKLEEFCSIFKKIHFIYKLLEKILGGSKGCSLQVYIFFSLLQIKSRLN